MKPTGSGPQAGSPAACLDFVKALVDTIPQWDSTGTPSLGPGRGMLDCFDHDPRMSDGNVMVTE